MARHKLLSIFPTPCTAPSAKGVGAEFVSRITLLGIANVLAVTCKNNMNAIPSDCSAKFEDGMRAKYGARTYAKGNIERATRYDRSVPSQAWREG